MKYFTTPNAKNIIATLLIITLEKIELVFLLKLYFHDVLKRILECMSDISDFS